MLFQYKSSGVISYFPLPNEIYLWLLESWYNKIMHDFSFYAAQQW